MERTAAMEKEVQLEELVELVPVPLALMAHSMAIPSHPGLMSEFYCVTLAPIVKRMTAGLAELPSQLRLMWEDVFAVLAPIAKRMTAGLAELPSYPAHQNAKVWLAVPSQTQRRVKGRCC
jgi:hypothetical protein